MELMETATSVLSENDPVRSITNELKTLHTTIAQCAGEGSMYGGGGEGLMHGGGGEGSMHGGGGEGLMHGGGGEGSMHGGGGEGIDA